MSEPILVPPRRGEVVGDSPDRRVEILSDHDALHATWSRFGPRREGADLHVHREHTDLFYVLDGELTLRLGPEGEEVAVPAGTLARVPPLVVHGFRNGSDAEVRYLNLHAPGRRFADYMRALRDGRDFTYDQHAPPADGGRPPEDAVVGGDADVEEITVEEVEAEPGAAPPQGDRPALRSLYVLEGALALETAGGETRVEAGAWAQLLPGVAHAVSAAGDARARYLDLHTPGLRGGAAAKG